MRYIACVLSLILGYSTSVFSVQSSELSKSVRLGTQRAGSMVCCCAAVPTTVIMGQLSGIQGLLAASGDKIEFLVNLHRCVPDPIREPITIIEPGYYCLANDIDGEIAIASNDVVLDLNSHQIRVDEGACVRIYQDMRNVAIENGTLVGDVGVVGVDFGTDNEVRGGQFNVIIDAVTTVSCDIGISIWNNSGNPVDGVDINNCRMIGLLGESDFTSGIALYCSEGALISNVSITNSSMAKSLYGLYVEGVLIKNISVDRTMVQQVGVAGFWFDHAANVLLTNSVAQNVIGAASSSYCYGVYSTYTSHLVVDQCTISGVNSSLEGVVTMGMYIDYATGAQITNNLILGIVSTQGNAWGILMTEDSPTDCIIHQNVVTYVLGVTPTAAIGIEWLCPGVGTAIATKNVVYMPGRVTYVGLPANAVNNDYNTATAWQNFYYPPEP